MGDFSNDFEVVAKVLPQLRGIHRLVVGNHDEGHPSRRAAWKMLKKYRGAGFEDVYEHVVLGDSAFGKVLLCHLPMGDADHENKEPRFMAWRPTAGLLEETGCVALLHGHVHGAWRTSWMNYGAERFKMINVGVDVNEFRPVSGKEVGRLLK